MAWSKLEKSLRDGISKNRPLTPYDEDIIRRYMQFHRDLKQFDEETEKNGVMIDVKNGEDVFRKVNPAVAEKQRLSKSMNDLLKIMGLDAKSLQDYSNEDDADDGEGLL